MVEANHIGPNRKFEFFRAYPPPPFFLFSLNECLPAALSATPR
jgi:hypothetical protein